MNYNKLNTLLQGRNYNRKKISNNTWAERDVIGDNIYIRLHNTRILTFLPDGNVKYNSEGWKTVTTKQRMNRFGPIHIYQKNFTWFISGSNEEYFDGITINPKTYETEAIHS